MGKAGFAAGKEPQREVCVVADATGSELLFQQHRHVFGEAFPPLCCPLNLEGGSREGEPQGRELLWGFGAFAKLSQRLEASGVALTIG